MEWLTGQDQNNAGSVQAADFTVLHLFYGACGLKQYWSPGVCVKLIGGGEPACLGAEDNNPWDVFRL